MTVFTVAQLDHLATVETQVIAFYQRMLATGADPEVVAGAVAIEVAGQPGLGQSQGLGLHECAGPGCHNVTDAPIRDEYAAFWIGDQAATYCSEDCLTKAAEEYWMNDQSVRDFDALYARKRVA